MGIVNWLRGKWSGAKSSQPEELPNDGPPMFAFTVAMSPDGRIYQTAELPALPDELAAEGCHNFAQLLYLLVNGKLDSVVQRAVAVAGEEGDLADAMAQVILAKLSAALRGTGAKDDEPVVPATKTFSARRDDD